MDLIRPDSRWSWFFAGTVWVLLFPGVWICLFDCLDAFLWFSWVCVLCWKHSGGVPRLWCGTIEWMKNWYRLLWLVELHGDDWIGLVYWVMIRVIVEVALFCRLVSSMWEVGQFDSICFGWGSRIQELCLRLLIDLVSSSFLLGWLPFPCSFGFFCSGILSGDRSLSFPLLSFCFVREQVCSLLSGEDCDGAENFL